MIGHQEVFFPSHEHVVGVLSAQQLIVVERIVVECVHVGNEGIELTPMLPIDVLVRFPFACEKRIPLRDDLGIEERRQNGILIDQASDAQVSAYVRTFEIHVMEDHIDVVGFSLGFLVAGETRRRTESGRAAARRP